MFMAYCCRYASSGQTNQNQKIIATSLRMEPSWGTYCQRWLALWALQTLRHWKTWKKKMRCWLDKWRRWRPSYMRWCFFLFKSLFYERERKPVYVYVCVCTYVCVYVYLCVCIHTYIHIMLWGKIAEMKVSCLWEMHDVEKIGVCVVCTYTYRYMAHMCICAYVYMCMYTYKSMPTYVCAHISTYARLHKNVHIHGNSDTCIHVYTHTYTHNTHTQSWRVRVEPMYI